MQCECPSTKKRYITGLQTDDRVDRSPDTNESRARRDLVPERVSDLSSSKGQFSLVEL